MTEPKKPTLADRVEALEQAVALQRHREVRLPPVDAIRENRFSQKRLLDAARRLDTNPGGPIQQFVKALLGLD